MDTIQRYNDYSTWIRKTFGERVQKISLHVGFTCPNRDGTRGIGGCTFCDNSTFNPAYCSSEKSIHQQLKEGIAFFSKKYPSQKYIAYFQAYSNTYSDIQVLKKKYEEALNHPGVIGISIATRPDCLPDDILDYLAELNTKTHLNVELGVESTKNETLKRINRGHDWECVIDAVKKLNDRNIKTALHIILGLPGENYEDIIQHIKKLNLLPFQFLKMHQMQVLKNTALEKEYEQKPDDFLSLTVESYVDLCIDCLEYLRPDIIIERFTSESPKHLIIAPNWNGVKNFEITEKIRLELLKRNTFQGKIFNQLY